MLSRQHCCSTATNDNSHFALLSAVLVELIISRSSQSRGIVCKSLYESFFFFFCILHKSYFPLNSTVSFAQLDLIFNFSPPPPPPPAPPSPALAS
jgi:hypothetical protein